MGMKTLNASHFCHPTSLLEVMVITLSPPSFIPREWIVNCGKCREVCYRKNVTAQRICGRFYPQDFFLWFQYKLDRNLQWCEYIPRVQRAASWNWTSTQHNTWHNICHNTASIPRRYKHWIPYVFLSIPTNSHKTWTVHKNKHRGSPPVWPSRNFRFACPLPLSFVF